MKTIFTFFLLVSFLNASDADRVGTLPLFFVQGMHIDSYQSLGFSNMFASSAIDLASGNPAVLNKINEISVGVNLNYSGEIKNAFSSLIDFEDSSPIFPGSFAVVVPLTDLKVALTYYQKYSSHINFDKIPIVTIEQPDGTGEFIEASKESKINSISGIFSTDLSNIFSSNDKLSIGLQVYFDTYSSYEKIYHTKATLKENDINWKIGANYRINENFQFGLLYEKGLDLTGSFKVSPSSLQTEGDDTSGSPIYAQFPYPKVRVHFPDKMVFGAQIGKDQDFSLSTTLSYIFWESVSNSYENHLDASVAVIYSVLDFAQISVGIYQTDLRLKNSNASNNGANFISAGLKFELSNVTAQLVVLDSHLSSDKSREQTIVNLGLGYSFH